MPAGEQFGSKRGLLLGAGEPSGGRTDGRRAGIMLHPWALRAADCPDRHGASPRLAAIYLSFAST